MGFLDGLFSKKAKAAKSDKARKPPTDVSRPANSTRAATFYAGLDPSTKNKRSKVTDATRRVDNNANIALQTQRPGSLRRRGKENVGGDVAVASLHPKAVTYRKESDPSKEKAQSSTLSLNNLLPHQPKTAQNQSSKPKRPTTVPNQVSSQHRVVSVRPPSLFSLKLFCESVECILKARERYQRPSINPLFSLFLFDSKVNQAESSLNGG
ncbi:hypothetical protein HUJ05_006069 [Dendroctonus ponderosae]|nr:hypothetical protein HUJ05_006069 [Dendroctonus ponderosae]